MQDMIEFELPLPKNDYEKLKYDRIFEALAAAEIPIIDGKYRLPIKKSVIFKVLEKKTGLKDFNKNFGIGCVGTPPHFEYSRNGTELLYKRDLFSSNNRAEYFKNGVADLKKISEALSIPENYFEVLSARRKPVALQILADYEKWRFTIKGHELSGKSLEQKGIGIERAAGILLDFYNSDCDMSCLESLLE